MQTLQKISPDEIVKIINEGPREYYWMDGIFIEGLQFNGLDITGDIQIGDVLKRGLKFENCTFKNVKFNHHNTDKYLEFNNCTIEGHIIVEYCTIKGIKISNSSIFKASLKYSTLLSGIEIV